jgi:hypothetical protein
MRSGARHACQRLLAIAKQLEDLGGNEEDAAIGRREPFRLADQRSGFVRLIQMRVAVSEADEQDRLPRVDLALGLGQFRSARKGPPNLIL